MKCLIIGSLIMNSCGSARVEISMKYSILTEKNLVFHKFQTIFKIQIYHCTQTTIFGL